MRDTVSETDLHPCAKFQPNPFNSLAEKMRPKLTDTQIHKQTEREKEKKEKKEQTQYPPLPWESNNSKPQNTKIGVWHSQSNFVLINWCFLRISGVSFYATTSLRFDVVHSLYKIQMTKDVDLVRRRNCWTD